MPPEPPHSQSDDVNEDAEVHQAALDGYQPLTAQAPDQYDNFSNTSESSSDESDAEDVPGSGQSHRICMTIQWPDEDAQEEQPSEDSAGLALSPDRKDPPTDQRDPSTDRKGPPTVGKDPSTDRKEPSTDRKDPPTVGKDPLAAAPCPQLRMSQDQTEAVRRAMRSIRLPEGAVPDWARGLSEQQCQQQIDQLVARLRGNR